MEFIEFPGVSKTQSFSWKWDISPTESVRTCPLGASWDKRPPFPFYIRVPLKMNGKGVIQKKARCISLFISYYRFAKLLLRMLIRSTIRWGNIIISHDQAASSPQRLRKSSEFYRNPLLFAGCSKHLQFHGIPLNVRCFEHPKGYP